MNARQTHGCTAATNTMDRPSIAAPGLPMAHDGHSPDGDSPEPAGGRHDASPAGQPFYQPLAEWTAARAALEGAER